MKEHTRLSKEKIEQYATDFLKQYSPENLEVAKKVDLESIIENQLKLSIDYQILDTDNNILGATFFAKSQMKTYTKNGDAEYKVFDKGTIVLNEQLALDERQQGRFQYTLGHEVGHWVLHQDIYYYDERQQTLFGSLPDVLETSPLCAKRNEKELTHKNLITNEDFIEWQADYFSSCVIMPKYPFLKEYDRLKKNGLTEGAIIDSLSDLFEVSKQACGIRIDVLTNKKAIYSNYSLLDGEA